jgi:hypothetical protein
MSSTVKLILGFSILATSVGCGSSSTSPGSGGSGPLPSGAGTGNVQASAGTGNVQAGAGTGNVQAGAGTGNTGTGGAGATTGGAGTLPEGIPLTPTDGWIDGMSNTLGVQGAVFMYGDPTSLGTPGMPGAMVGTFTGAQACIKGTAAKVDLTSPVCVSKMFTPPATDCYGEYWGAAIGMNLNQPKDMTTMMGGTPIAFNASTVKGFAFTLDGPVVPIQIRFKVEDASGEFCNTAMKPVKKGANTFMLADLIKACYAPMAGAATGESAKTGLLKIAWQVYTVTSAAIPFDICVSDVRALQ